MDVKYVIVKVSVTERNHAIKRLSNVITIWRTSAIEVTALIKKNLRSEMKRCAKKGIYHIPRDHILSSLGKPRDARQWSSG